MTGARLVVTDESSRVVGVAMFGTDGTALRADLKPLRALAIGRRRIVAAERALLECEPVLWPVGVEPEAG